MLRFLLRVHSARTIRSHTRDFVLLAFFLALLGGARESVAQQSNIAQAVPDRAKVVKSSDDATIEELINERIKEEWATAGADFHPEMVRTEADYARLSVSSKDLLYEASFHLQPHYYSHSATGPDTAHRTEAEQPIMYYVGTARTPLALPMVSNLSKALSGDEASYTVNIGVLPLPDPTSQDSMRYFVVIERTIESNHTDNYVRLERFVKEFSAKTGDPAYLRIANESLAKAAVIVQLESGAVLDFDDDFSRFIDEHIIIKSDKLDFKLGQQTVSDISNRLSIPYSVARTCEAKVELLSVVDTEHSLTIIDTLRQPANYLAELDMSKFADGPYRYRFTAIEPVTGKVIYTETREFHKSEPITVSQSSRSGGPSDTLKIGGKKIDWAALLAEENEQIDSEQVLNERMKSTLDQSKSDKDQLQKIVNANQQSAIADVHGRAGFGIGDAAGENFFIGIESNRPALSFDVSFGMMYAPVPYLNYTLRGNVSNFFLSPKSLGFQLQYIPVKFFNGIIEPLIGVAYYGTWSSAQTGVTSAPLLSGQIGIACEPLGEMHGLGFSLCYGAAYGLGLSPASYPDWSFKAYIRF